MNMLVWWFALMIPAWILTAWVLWGTSIVFSEDDDADVNEGETRDE